MQFFQIQYTVGCLFTLIKCEQSKANQSMLIVKNMTFMFEIPTQQIYCTVRNTNFRTHQGTCFEKHLLQPLFTLACHSVPNVNNSLQCTAYYKHEEMIKAIHYFVAFFKNGYTCPILSSNYGDNMRSHCMENVPLCRYKEPPKLILAHR